MEPVAVRAVVDTNILVRGILRRRQSVAVVVFDAMLLERFVPVTSEYVLAEVRKTLLEPDVRKLRDLSTDQIDAMVGLLREVSEVVPGRLQNLEKVPTDTKDNAVVAAAVEGGADFLVTDDRRDLLPLKVVKLAGFRPVQIVAARDFMRELAKVVAVKS